MKKIAFITAMSFYVVGARCDVPPIQCPSGYTKITSPEIVLASSCPANYTNCGDASSCAAQSPDGVCFVYAPAGIPYNDTTGQYEYTEICMLDESI